MCGLLCFAMPLASIVFAGILGATHVSAETTGAGKAGAAIGTALAGGVITVVSGIVGFFLGLIFIIGSYFSLRTR